MMLKAEPLDELLDDELLELDELELELDELDEELLDELPPGGLVVPPPQAANAVAKAVNPHAKKVLFMIRFHINMMRNFWISKKQYPQVKPCLTTATFPVRL